MQKYIVLVMTILSLLNFAGAKSYDTFELPNIQVIPIKDEKLNRQYELYVKVPEDYHEHTEKKYPVIYFTDAIWHIEILSVSTEFLMKDVILVGISWQKDLNDTTDQNNEQYFSRFRDYTFRQSLNKGEQVKYLYGGAEDHLNFVRNGVIPFIEKNYRAETNNRTYFGYSLGGLFGAYTLVKQPDVFKNYILGSPAIGGDSKYLAAINSADRTSNKLADINVYISYGELEKKLGQSAETFIALFNQPSKGLPFIQRDIIESSDHGTAFPLTGVRSITWLSKLK